MCVGSMGEEGTDRGEVGEEMRRKGGGGGRGGGYLAKGWHYCDG